MAMTMRMKITCRLDRRQHHNTGYLEIDDRTNNAYALPDPSYDNSRSCKDVDIIMLQTAQA